MNKAQNLKIEGRILDKAPIPTHVFVCNFCFANVTFILNFDKININYKSANLYNMSDNVVTWNGFQKLDSIVGSKIIYFFLNATNHLKIVFKQLNLNINV